MKEGWEIKRLGDVCNVYNGTARLRNNQDFWLNGTVNWFTIDDIRDQGRRIFYTAQKITRSGLSKSGLTLLPKKTVLLLSVPAGSSSRDPAGTATTGF
jgi:restriction endonuclease S subunit